MKVGIHRAGDVADLFHEIRSDATVVLLITSDDLDIEWRRQAEIQSLTDDVGRQEVKQIAGKLLVQRVAQATNVNFRGLVAGIERNQNVRVARPNHTAGIVAEIHAGIRN